MAQIWDCELRRIGVYMCSIDLEYDGLGRTTGRVLKNVTASSVLLFDSLLRARPDGIARSLLRAAFAAGSVSGFLGFVPQCYG